MGKLETTDTQLLLEEILSSANALKEATKSQKEILDTVALNRLERVMAHKNMLIDKIRAIHQALRERGIDLADRNGYNPEGDGGPHHHYEHQDHPTEMTSEDKVASQKIAALRRTVERTIREILALEADSQRKLLSLKQHVRGILLEIQERRKMLRGYAVHPGRFARVLDTKS